jgi:hypothetical protein
MTSPEPLQRICCATWRGARYEVPSSVQVTHVCDRPEGHEGPCHCYCGADR